LAAWLAGWRTADALERGSSAGAFLETYVVSEILKGYAHHAETAPIHFFRDHEGREIDVLVTADNIATPVEVKLTSKPDGRTARKMLVGGTIGLDQGDGALVAMVAAPYPLGPKVSAWPVGLV
jgi:predicted AAA+ superfamily ATPase